MKKIKLRFDVADNAKPSTLVLNTSDLTPEQLNWIADRLLGIDLCTLWNSDDGTVKLRDSERRPIRLVATAPTFAALLAAITKDQRIVEGRLATHRHCALVGAIAYKNPIKPNFSGNPRPLDCDE